MNEDDLIDRAAQILRDGGLVAFPTETVYGLGADATSEQAVTKIFAAKGRPSTNPLIVHVASANVARRFAAAWPPAAGKISGAFWPGPITLVLPKDSSIVPQVTAGKMTVGLRMPKHPLTLKLLGTFDGAIAGPSANRSSRISPTTAAHVQSELGASVDLILDGGPCSVGIESTVLDLTTSRPTILRPGAISKSQIESIIGPVNEFNGATSPAQSASSPGQHEIHYAPLTPAFRFEANEIEMLNQWRRMHPDDAIIVLAINPLSRDRRIEMPRSPEQYAKRFYAALHEADAVKAQAIWIELPPNLPEWVAIRDRIRRATSRPT